MENKLASQFFAENIGQLFLDFANKKIRSQDHFDLYWHKIFQEGQKIEKQQITDAFIKGENTIIMDAEEYYNETYLK